MQGGRLETFFPHGNAFDGWLRPIDDFQGIDAGDEILIEGEHVEDLLGVEGNIGVHEQKMCCFGMLQKLRNQCVATACDERVMTEKCERDVKARLPAELDEAQDGLHVMLRDEATETGRREKDQRTIRLFDGIERGHLFHWSLTGLERDP